MTPNSHNLSIFILLFKLIIYISLMNFFIPYIFDIHFFPSQNIAYIIQFFSKLIMSSTSIFTDKEIRKEFIEEKIIFRQLFYYFISSSLVQCYWMRNINSDDFFLLYFKILLKLFLKLLYVFSIKQITYNCSSSLFNLLFIPTICWIVWL